MRKILVVEDEEMLRDTYQFILSTEPYDIYTAADGKIALELCEKHDFDLILLDLMMPVMNGVEFLEHFKADDRPNTKVIITSNLSAGDMLNKALEMGAQRNIVKADITPKELISTVRYEVEAT